LQSNALVGRVAELTSVGGSTFMASIQKFFIRILPRRWAESMEAHSRSWMIRCRCGFAQSVRETGGIRWKAAGKPRRFMSCPQCGQVLLAQGDARPAGGLAGFQDMTCRIQLVRTPPDEAAAMNRRSAPVLGRRNIRTVEALGQGPSGWNAGRFCARGRAHSGSRAQCAQKVRGILS